MKRLLVLAALLLTSTAFGQTNVQSLEQDQLPALDLSCPIGFPQVYVSRDWALPRACVGLCSVDTSEKCNSDGDCSAGTCVGTWQSLLPERGDGANVVDHGALPDDQLADQTQMQSAIDYVESRFPDGGKVTLACGRYIISTVGGLQISKPITFEGCGPNASTGDEGATVIALTNAGAIGITVGDGVTKMNSGPIIRSLTVKDESAGRDAEGGIRFRLVGHITMENVTAENFRNGGFGFSVEGTPAIWSDYHTFVGTRTWDTNTSWRSVDNVSDSLVVGGNFHGSRAVCSGDGSTACNNDGDCSGVGGTCDADCTTTGFLDVQSGVCTGGGAERCMYAADCPGAETCTDTAPGLPSTTAGGRWTFVRSTFNDMNWGMRLRATRFVGLFGPVFENNNQYLPSNDCTTSKCIEIDAPGGGTYGGDHTFFGVQCQKFNEGIEADNDTFNNTMFGTVCKSISTSCVDDPGRHFQQLGSQYTDNYISQDLDINANLIMDLSGGNATFGSGTDLTTILGLSGQTRLQGGTTGSAVLRVRTDGDTADQYRLQVKAGGDVGLGDGSDNDLFLLNPEFGGANYNLSLTPGGQGGTSDLAPALCFDEDIGGGGHGACLQSCADAAGIVNYKWPCTNPSGGDVLSTSAAGQLSWTAAASISGYSEIQDEGTPLATQTSLDCVGLGVQCYDNTTETKIEVPGLVIEDEGTSVTPTEAPDFLDFVGAGVTCSGIHPDSTCTIPGVAIEDEDAALTYQPIVNFTGAGVSCANGTGQVDCTIPGGAGAEVNNLETDGAEDILDNELFQGSGAGTGTYVTDLQEIDNEWAHTSGSGVTSEFQQQKIDGAANSGPGNCDVTTTTLCSTAGGECGAETCINIETDEQLGWSYNSIDGGWTRDDTDQQLWSMKWESNYWDPVGGTENVEFNWNYQGRDASDIRWRPFGLTAYAYDTGTEEDTVAWAWRSYSACSISTHVTCSQDSDCPGAETCGNNGNAHLGLNRAGKVTWGQGALPTLEVAGNITANPIVFDGRMNIGVDNNESGLAAYGINQQVNFNSSTATSGIGTLVGARFNTAFSSAANTTVITQMTGVDVDMDYSASGTTPALTNVTGQQFSFDATGATATNISNLTYLNLVAPVHASATFSNMNAINIGDMGAASVSGTAIKIASQGSGVGTRGNIRMEGGGAENGHIHLGGGHFWHDPTNDVFRTKMSTPFNEVVGGAMVTDSQADPVTEVDGTNLSITANTLNWTGDTIDNDYGDETITSTWTINDVGTGALTAYDVTIGDSADYGIIRVGDAVIGRTNNTTGYNLNGALIFQNPTGPVTGDIEFGFLDSANLLRFGLPKSATGNATYNSRCFLNAGPAIADSDIVTVGYWQGVGIFDNLTCDTGTDGADMGVQNSLEVEDTIFVDTIAESTAAAGVTIDGVLLQDSAIPLLTTHESDTSTHGVADMTALITATGVTYGNLETNADIGFGSGQVPQGVLTAPLAGPALTGDPTAPTATVGDSDTSIATTDFVDRRVTKVCRTVEDLTTADLNVFLGGADAAFTFTGVACNADAAVSIRFEDYGGTAIETIACDTDGTLTWDKTLSGTATIIANEVYQFDVTSDSTPTWTTLCYLYRLD